MDFEWVAYIAYRAFITEGLPSLWLPTRNLYQQPLIT